MDYHFNGTVKQVERTTKEKTDLEVETGKVVISDDDGNKCVITGLTDGNDFTQEFRPEQKVKVVITTPQTTLAAAAEEFKNSMAEVGVESITITTTPRD
jgi:hypothetical protein